MSHFEEKSVRWKGIIEIDFKEIEWEELEWYDLAQDRFKWWVYENKHKYFGLENFLTSCSSITFQ
jgi:hypothetical protein